MAEIIKFDNYKNKKNEYMYARKVLAKSEKILDTLMQYKKSVGGVNEMNLAMRNELTAEEKKAILPMIQNRMVILEQSLYVSKIKIDLEENMAEYKLLKSAVEKLETDI